MHNALKASAVDGIFIDQYVGAHYLGHLLDDDLRILTIIPYEIVYRTAFLDVMSQSMLTQECFEEVLDQPSPQHFLQKYVSPSKVSY